MQDTLQIARAIHAAGGRALAVGGYVRDRLLGHESKDCDIEVFGLELEALQALLEGFGRVLAVGRAFGVLRLADLDVDFSLPRRDSKVGPGTSRLRCRGGSRRWISKTASRRRDLTVNSMGLDLLSGEVLDPHGGRRDLESGTLRAVDPHTFPEDPLRGLRVAQFSARLEMLPDAELIRLCRELDLAEVSPERILEEFRKLLLKGVRPSLGLAFLRESDLLRHFPELAALVGVPQDPTWHPEGDVWTHNLMVIDEAAQLRRGDADDWPLMLGALCHDFGKPATTVLVDGRVRSPAHAHAGIAPTRAFLQDMRAPHDAVERTCALVEHHLAPALFDKDGAKAKAYRRLSRKLGGAGVTMELLARVARADHFGRTTPDALARDFSAGERFLERARELEVVHEAPRDVVQGRHLIARGLSPGPRFGELLARCRTLQDESGWQDVEQILDRVLGKRQP